MQDERLIFLEDLAKYVIKKSTLKKETCYFGKKEMTDVLIPGGDETYYSFWVRDCAMMVESGLVDNDSVKKYIEIFSTCGQNGKDTLYLENGLIVPPYAVCDHVNYNGKPVFFPGTYDDGANQGTGKWGTYPPFCDNYYYVIMVNQYLKQSNDYQILENVYNGIKLIDRIKYAFIGYNVDKETDLCYSEKGRHTVSWGFTDSVRMNGLVLYGSILRYNAAKCLYEITKDSEYSIRAEKIRQNIIDKFYDEESGWFYSSTGDDKQHDVNGTVYAVFSGISNDIKIAKAVTEAYIDGYTTKSGYIRHIATNKDYERGVKCWADCGADYDNYQNGAYWATGTGWYAYTMSLYSKECALRLIDEYISHTKLNLDNGSPFEYFNAYKKQAKWYGTSGVIPFIGYKKMIENNK